MTDKKSTQSVCPVCRRKLNASRVARGEDVFLRKTCPEHGDFECVIWRGGDSVFDKWWDVPATPDSDAASCPDACGLCENHLQKTCCVLVEVTNRCNLRCPVCFARGGERDAREKSVSELYDIFRTLVARGSTFVQLSGGEPTVRDDLPDIVAAARRAGCETVQLNTNGLRLAREPQFTKRLADAGLSFVFLQFDGTRDEIYASLRGEKLLAEKLAAIDVCADNMLGVTLVPTIVPGVNDGNIGEILKLGFARSPAVRGVHFQPISYFGRYPEPPTDAERITLPEILRAIELQTDGKIKMTDFLPSSCDHPRCGFHGDFVVLPKGVILRLTPKYDPETAGCCSPDSHLKNRKFVSRRWTRAPSGQNPPGEGDDYRDMGNFLSRVKSHGFTVTAMAFQDAYTLELPRLRRCSLHVYDGERTVPFCANYIFN
jgi:uncharacterized radical SAM superfamily Fe-S cluster-containing enzyme